MISYSRQNFQFESVATRESDAKPEYFPLYVIARDSIEIQNKKKTQGAKKSRAPCSYSTHQLLWRTSPFLLTIAKERIHARNINLSTRKQKKPIVYARLWSTSSNSYRCYFATTKKNIYTKNTTYAKKIKKNFKQILVAISKN